MDCIANFIRASGVFSGLWDESTIDESPKYVVFISPHFAGAEACGFSYPIAHCMADSRYCRMSVIDSRNSRTKRNRRG